MNRFLLALLSGILFALSWPTYGQPLLLFFAFVPLLIVEFFIRNSDTRFKKWQIFGYSYLTFLIWNFVTTSWLRFASEFGAAFAILVNSMLMAIVMVLYHTVANRTTLWKACLFFVSIWISFEYMHLHWDFSWPWLNLGNAFSEHYKWIQWYEYTGTFGGSLWVLLVNMILYYGTLHFNLQNSKRLLKSYGLSSLGIILIPILISLFMYYSYEEKGKEVNVVALQPNIDPYDEKYNIPNNQIADLFIQLSDSKVTDSTDFILAPETVFAYNVKLRELENALFKYQLDKYVNEHPNINLLTGVSFIDFITDPEKVTPKSNYFRDSIWYNDYNSAILINAKDSTQFYHKSKLVVGIEDLPYQSILKPLIGDFMIDLGGTVAMKTKQENRSVFTSADKQFSAGPIICYESVYGEFVTGYVRNGANLLTIITNDAWWNNTQGHKQHLSYARLRAIETRRPIGRSANTGISAMINQKGDIIESLPYNRKGAISGTLHTNEEWTFYTWAGDYIARISLFLFLLLGLITWFRRPRTVL